MCANFGANANEDYDEYATMLRFDVRRGRVNAKMEREMTREKDVVVWRCLRGEK